MNKNKATAPVHRASISMQATMTAQIARRPRVNWFGRFIAGYQAPLVQAEAPDLSSVEPQAHHGLDIMLPQFFCSKSAAPDPS
jgi:hypothetical protein